MTACRAVAKGRPGPLAGWTLVPLGAPWNWARTVARSTSAAFTPAGRTAAARLAAVIAMADDCRLISPWGKELPAWGRAVN